MSRKRYPEGEKLDLHCACGAEFTDIEGGPDADDQWHLHVTQEELRAAYAIDGIALESAEDFCVCSGFLCDPDCSVCRPSGQPSVIPLPSSSKEEVRE